LKLRIKKLSTDLQEQRVILAAERNESSTRQKMKEAALQEQLDNRNEENKK